MLRCEQSRARTGEGVVRCAARSWQQKGNFKQPVPVCNQCNTTASAAYLSSLLQSVVACCCEPGVLLLLLCVVLLDTALHLRRGMLGSVGQSVSRWLAGCARWLLASCGAHRAVTTAAFCERETAVPCMTRPTTKATRPLPATIAD